MTTSVIGVIFVLLNGAANGMSSSFNDHDAREVSSLLKSLLFQLVPQLPRCVVVLYSDSETVHQLPNDILAIRVNINSAHMKKSLLASYEMRCNGYITDSSSVVFMLNALAEVRLEAKERHLPKILILPSNYSSTNTSCAIFEHPEVDYIPDIIMTTVKKDINGSFVLRLLTNSFTNKESQKCETFGYWPSDVDNYFPDKIENLNGRDIRVATLEFPPYSILAPEFDGMETRLIKEFCRIHNCTLTLVTDDDLWGEIYGNGTGTGLSGNVYMDLADFGMGAVYAWEKEYHYVDYSYPYLNTRVTVLVPKPKQLPEWRIPLLPFSLTMWAIQLFSVFVAAVIMYFVNKMANKLIIESKLRGEFASFGGTILRVIAMAVLQPPPSRLPPSSPLRRFFALFEVLFFFFTTIYSGALSSVLTVPMYYPPIDTPLELYESGIPWVAMSEAWTYSLQGATEKHLQGLISRFEAHDADTLVDLTKKGGYGFPIEIMAAGHATQEKHLSGEVILGLHVMKTELYKTSLVFLFRKGSPYAEKMNNLLSKAVDFGLLLLWETDVTLTYGSSRLQTAVKLSERAKIEVHEPTQLRIVHVQGTFILLGLGLCVSFILFLFEYNSNDK